MGITKLIGAVIIVLIICSLLICDIIMPTEKRYKSLEKENKDLKKVIKTLVKNEDELRKKIDKERMDLETIYIKKYIAFKTIDLKDDVILEVSNAIVKGAIEYGYPFCIIVGLADVESKFNPEAISKKGARGLLQVMFSVWSEDLNIKHSSKLHDPYDGIRYGINVLDFYMQMYDDDLVTSLHAYNSKNASKYKFAGKVCRAACEYLIFRGGLIKEDIQNRTISGI